MALFRVSHGLLRKKLVLLQCVPKSGRGYTQKRLFFLQTALFIEKPCFHKETQSWQDYQGKERVKKGPLKLRKDTMIMMMIMMTTMMENLSSIRVVEYINLLLLVFILFAIIMFARSLDPLIWNVSHIRNDFENFIQGFTEAEAESQDKVNGEYIVDEEETEEKGKEKKKSK
jgi:hypothetical protein